MPRFILHHYEGSPFSEKIRLIFGFKQLDWASVIVPAVMPKPDVIALTGGYRRTPFLQVGADVYCDTALIARVIDEAAPTPPLYPPQAAGAPLIAQWADSTLFWTVIPFLMQQPAALEGIFAGLPPEALKAFRSDRASFAPDVHRPSLADATVMLDTYLEQLDAMLADGRSFLFGSEPSIADFSVAHNVWFIRRAPKVAGILDARTRLNAWFARVQAFGHGRMERLASSDALTIAAQAAGFAAATVQPGQGFEPGEPVRVSASDYGRDPVAGRLVGLTPREIVIEREDERAGRVHVHFPRIGFDLKKEGNAA
jgi:glutathione S-transferase